MNIAKQDFQNLLSADCLNKIKTEAYNRGILVEDMYTIFGIYLRDYILKSHNMPVADVDKFDPENTNK
jgi:hypothetical protein